MENKEILIKQKTILSQVIQSLTERFLEICNGGDIKLKNVIWEENTLKLTGNFDIDKSEIHKRNMEFGGKIETYTIILIPLNLSQ